jgi:lysophospholipase L1-like esterase
MIFSTLSALVVATFAAHGLTDTPPIFGGGETILFQGDSITDGNRGRTPDPNHILGHGYVFIIAAKYGATFPERNLTFINRGVSGNTVENLAQRWKADTLDNKPDVLSILVGVNDVYFAFQDHKQVALEAYEARYDQILTDTVKANPNVKFVLCDPFILHGRNTDAQFDNWVSTMNELRTVVARLAKKYHAPVVHFQKVFDDACKRAPFNYWIWDGIHPTYSGHQLMADEWIKTYRSFYGTKR